MMSLLKSWLMRIVVFSFAFSAFLVHAASVERQDFKQLVSKSSLVFEGEVRSVDASWNTSHSRIYTWVTFDIEEVMKGEWTQDTITLRFTGGTVGQDQLSVPGMRYPEAGERGMYFVESTENKQFNPLLGWEQGQFKYISDSLGEDRLCTASGLPVESIDSSAESTSSLSERGVGLPAVEASGSVERQAGVHGSSGLSNGRVKGVKTLRRSQLAEAMSRQQFKRLVRSVAADASKAVLSTENVSPAQ